MSEAYIYRYFSRLDTVMFVRYPESVCGRVLQVFVKIINKTNYGEGIAFL